MFINKNFTSGPDGAAPDRFKCFLLENQFLSAIDGILLVSPMGKILGYNDNFARIWGVPEEILETGEDEKVLAVALPSLADPDAFLAKVKYLYAHPEEKSTDRIELKDGRILDRYSSAINGPANDYLGRVWYFRDATVRENAIKEAIENRNKSQTLFNSAGDAIFIHALSDDVYKQKFIEVNKMACEKLGYSKEELLGKTPFDLEVRPPNVDVDKVVEERTDQLRRTGALIFQTGMRAKNGEIIPFEFNSRPADFTDQKVLVSIARDISERMKMAELQELNRLKDDFLNITTHELRTPLTSIIGLSELIAKKKHYPHARRKKIYRDHPRGGPTAGADDQANIGRDQI